MLYLLTKILKEKIEKSNSIEIKNLSKGELYIISLDNDLKDAAVRKGLRSNDIKSNAKEIFYNQESFNQAYQDIINFIITDCEYKSYSFLENNHKAHPLAIAAECFKYSHFKYADGKKFIWEKDAANQILHVVQQGTGYCLNLEDRLKMTLICQKNGADNYFTYAYPYGGCPNNYTKIRGNDNEKKILNKLLTHSAKTIDDKNEKINACKQSIALDFISYILKDCIEVNKLTINHDDECISGGEQAEISIFQDQ